MDYYGRTIWYLGGGGARKLKKKKKIATKVIKKIVENVGRKKSLLSKYMKNMLTRKKHQIVTYIIGKAYVKKFLRRNIKKNCRTLIAKKNIVFSRR